MQATHNNKESDMNHTETSVSEMVELVLEGIDEISPYRFAKCVSKVVGYKVPPQMIYSYVKNGRIPTHLNTLDHLVVRGEDAAAWLTTFAIKVLVKDETQEEEV
jgi:hypothetical protein